MMVIEGKTTTMEEVIDAYADDLSPRQELVFRWGVRGLTCEDTDFQMCITTKAVRYHCNKELLSEIISECIRLEKLALHESRKHLPVGTIRDEMLEDLGSRI